MSPLGFPCLRCGRVYRYIYTRNNHMRNECGIDPQFQCPYCPRKCAQKGNLARHIEVMHVKASLIDPVALGRFPCHRCNRHYSQRTTLVKHLKNECGVEPKYHCLYCPKKCAQKGNLISHIRKNHQDLIPPEGFDINLIQPIGEAQEESATVADPNKE